MIFSHALAARRELAERITIRPKIGQGFYDYDGAKIRPTFSIISFLFNFINNDYDPVHMIIDGSG